MPLDLADRAGTLVAFLPKCARTGCHMASHKSREQRVTASLNARMRADDGWSDVTISNVSSRGLMVRRGSSPAKGSYVEIWHQNVCIIGHVRWSHSDRFGVRSQDKIDILALLDSPRAKLRVAGVERRSGPRSSSKLGALPDVAVQADASRRIAKVFDWLAIAIIGSAISGMLVAAVDTALEEPMQRAKFALETSVG